MSLKDKLLFLWILALVIGTSLASQLSGHLFSALEKLFAAGLLSFWGN
jgi:hypothetical protein